MAEKSPKITDEYVLSKETLTSQEAADYLHKSWWDLTSGLQDGTYKFGEARQTKSGRWKYTIYSERIYKFKHGTYNVDQQQFSDLCCQLSEAVGLMKTCVELMTTLTKQKA